MDFLTVAADMAWPFAIALAWIAGEFGHRVSGLPRISIYGITGFLLGQTGLFGQSGSGPVMLLANIAFGLILFEFGYRINLKWLRLNPWIAVTGVVEAVGDDVGSVAVGDVVYAMVRFPVGLAGDSRAYAEYVSVPVSEVGIKPRGFEHVHAAAAPMSLLTAWQFLIDLGHDQPNPLQPDQHRPVPLAGRTVLVNGAGGGVGHLALQIAKWKGARAIAVASGRHEALLRDLGADEVIDYTRTRPEDVVRGADLVIDAVGGAATRRFLPTLKRGGALFPIFPLGFDAGTEAAELGVTVSATQVRSNGAQLTEIGRLLDAGTIRVVIDSVFPLADARKAHERAAAGHVQGKIVLTVD